MLLRKKSLPSPKDRRSRHVSPHEQQSSGGRSCVVNWLSRPLSPASSPCPLRATRRSICWDRTLSISQVATSPTREQKRRLRHRPGPKQRAMTSGGCPPRQYSPNRKARSLPLLRGTMEWLDRLVCLKVVPPIWPARGSMLPRLRHRSCPCPTGQ